MTGAPGLRMTLWAAGVTVVVLLMYVGTLAPSLIPGDGSELQTVAATRGVPHEPGYPTWLYVSQAFQALPFGTPAWRTNLMSAVLGALASGLLQALLMRLGVRVWIALAASLTVASMDEFWAQSVIAEVYTLHIFFAALLLHLGLSWTREPSTRRLMCVAVAAAFGAGNHPSIGALVPGGLVLMAASKPGPFFRPRPWLIATTLGVLLFMGLYLYVPLSLASERGVVYARLREPEVMRQILRGWWAYTRGAQWQDVVWAYGVGDLWSRLEWYTRLLLEQLGVLWPVAAVVGIVAGSPRPMVVGLTVGGILSMVLPLVTGVAAAPQYALTSLVVWGICAGLGAEALFARLRPEARRARCGLVLLIMATPAWLLTAGLQHFSERHSRDTELSARRVMEEVEREAVLLSTWPTYTPLLYLQRVEGLRPDVTLTNAHSDQWLEAVTRDLAQGRRVHLREWHAEVALHFELDRSGPTWKVVRSR